MQEPKKELKKSNRSKGLSPEQTLLSMAMAEMPLREVVQSALGTYIARRLHNEHTEEDTAIAEKLTEILKSVPPKK